jgi:hypothetical protein
MEFIIGLCVLRGRRRVCNAWFRVTRNIQVYALHDYGLQVTYQPSGKETVLAKPIPQNGKSEVASEPDERVKVQHPTAISLDHPEMACDWSKNPYSARTSSEEVVEDAFTGMVKELGVRNGIRCRCRTTDRCSSSREGVSGIFKTTKAENGGFRKSEGLMVIQKAGMPWRAIKPLISERLLSF